MEDNQTCQVSGCTWLVVLCPELCASHWWKLPKDKRHAITRAQVAGQKAGNHPSPVYLGLVDLAIRSLNLSRGSLAVYEREEGDFPTRHTVLTWCANCNQQTVHHGFIRDDEPGLWCILCFAIIPAYPSGSQPLPGMEVSP